MAVIIIDGRVRVTSCTSVSAIQSPTVAEANAGTVLEQYITPDGLDISIKTGKVKASNLRSTFTTYRAGRKVPDVKVMFHHESGTDVPYNLFVYRATGFLLVRRGVDATQAWAIGDKLEVYPWESAEAEHKKPGEDDTWDFTSELFITADPATRAVMV